MLNMDHSSIPYEAPGNENRGLNPQKMLELLPTRSEDHEDTLARMHSEHHLEKSMRSLPLSQGQGLHLATHSACDCQYNAKNPP